MRLTSPNMKDIPTLHDHVYRNELDSVRFCLKNSLEDVNSVDRNGRTPLIVAACFNRHDVIDLIMTSSQCDVNLKDHDGNTALHEAADRGYTEVVRKLVESGRCDINIRNDLGQTALMMAAIYDYIEIVRILLKSGLANPDVSDSVGQTALHVALREGSYVTADALIKTGCDVNAVDKMGKSALYMAIHSPFIKSLEPAKRIVESGCDLSIDKMWILNEEKHNIFYQDDDFYASLRRKMRHNSAETRLQSTPSALYTQICPQEGDHSKAPLQRTISTPPLSLSPMVKQKIITTEALPNGLAMDWRTPPGSPVRSRRTSSRSSITSSRSSLPSKSSFDSDMYDSPCSSPSVFAYPTAHIDFHNLTRNDSEYSDKNVTSFRNDHVTSTTSLEKADGFRMADDINRKSSANTVNNFKRQQSEQISGAYMETGNQPRKISLPCKPSVQFSETIQIIDISKRL